MKEILDKISSYNLFNYLFPGVIFVSTIERLTVYKFFQTDILVNGFVAYFFGFVLSRFGSLLIEPFFKKVNFLHFADYPSYVLASKKDPKIELFSELNNTYRTLVSMFIIFFLFKTWELIEFRHPVLKVVSPYILIGFLLLLFLFSYKKQTEYVVKRIKLNSK